jgi:lipoate-protein ligase A
MEPWRLLPLSVEPTALQLATGDALLAGLEETRQPALRWHVTHAPALVLGVGQKLHEVNLAACRVAGVPIHRRASGGTAVLLGPEALMLTVALPKAHRLSHSDVTESYRWSGEVWVAALHALGLNSRLIPIQQARDDLRALDPLTRRVCFGGYSPYEVLAGSRKLVGLAQVRRRSGALIEAAIYRQWQPERLVPLLALAPEERAALQIRLLERATGLASERHPPPTFEEITTAFAVALRETQQVELIPSEWRAVEQETRHHQSHTRYAPLSTKSE